MSATQQHGLGYIHEPHNLHEVRPLEAFAPSADAPLPTHVKFDIGPVLDQKQTPRCVAFMGRDWLTAGPVKNTGRLSPATIYRECQGVDGIQGPHDGTTVHALVQVETRRGYIKGPVAWTKTVDTIGLFMRGPIGQPVTLGIPWTQGMFTPDANGFIFPTGPIEGGHGLMTFEYDAINDVYSLMNHWSIAWGTGGICYIHGADLGWLLKRQAEACAAIEQLKGRSS